MSSMVFCRFFKEAVMLDESSDVLDIRFSTLAKDISLRKERITK